MAGLIVSAVTPVAVSLTAATAKTVVQVLAPANQRLRIRKISFAFDTLPAGSVAVLVRLLFQGSAGTGGTAVTAAKVSAGSETIQGSATYNVATTEPSLTSVLDTFSIRPQLGADISIPMDSMIEVPGGSRLGIECTCSAAATFRAKVQWEE